MIDVAGRFAFAILFNPEIAIMPSVMFSSIKPLSAYMLVLVSLETFLFALRWFHHKPKSIQYKVGTIKCCSNKKVTVR